MYETLTDGANTRQNQLNRNSTWKRKKTFITVALLFTILSALSFTVLGIEKEKLILTREKFPTSFCCKQNEIVNGTDGIKDLFSTSQDACRVSLTLQWLQRIMEYFDLRLKAPFTAIIAGPTSSGKTVLLKSLISNAHDVCVPLPKKLSTVTEYSKRLLKP